MEIVNDHDGKLLKVIYHPKDPSPRKRQLLIASGHIASGKTTLIRNIEKYLYSSDIDGTLVGYHALYEDPYKNPRFPKYCEYLSRPAEMQAEPDRIYYFTQRNFLLWKAIMCDEASHVMEYEGMNAALDRAPWDDLHVFAKNLKDQGKITQPDWEKLLELNSLLFKDMKLDLELRMMVYLHNILPRMKEERDRPEERQIPKEYLETVDTSQKKQWAQPTNHPVLYIDTNKYDFANNGKDTLEVLTQVATALEGN